MQRDVSIAVLDTPARKGNIATACKLHLCLTQKLRYTLD